MHETAEGIAKSLGGVCQLEIKKGYPVLENDAHLVSRTRVWMEEYLSREKVVDLPIRLTAEDFAFYSQIIPACFYRLGTGNAVRGITSAVHTPTFDVDEAALGTGMGLLAWLAVQELAHPL
jgi:metal-dependent amidase/aminoacylase/carboxypeptidase family protein